MNGAEALQKIMDDTDEIKKMMQELTIAVSLIQSNIKFLNNRASGLLRAEPAVNHPQEQKQVIRNQNVVLPDIDRSNIIHDETPGVMTYKKVYGRLFDSAMNPIDDALIRVFDKNNEVCATTETDPSGYWETSIRPGRYSASYTKSGMREQNKAFELRADMKTLEVT